MYIFSTVEVPVRAIVISIALVLALLLGALPVSSKSLQYVTGYYPTWAWSNGYTDKEVPWDMLTHLILFSTNPMTTSPYYDSTEYFTYESWIPTLISTAHANNVKIILCVGGVWGTGATTMDSISVDSVKTYTFAERAASFAYRKGFDGIDIDWETNMANQNAHDRMLRAFDKYLRLWPTKGLLTIAETQDVGSTYGYRASALNAYVDQVNMMNYDLGQGQTSGHNTALHQPSGWDDYTSWAIEDHGPKLLLNMGVSQSKVALGLAFYARGNYGVYEPGQTKSSYYSPYYNYDVVAALDKSNYNWDAGAQVPWLGKKGGGLGGSLPDSLSFVSYDDSMSIDKKVHYADSLGLGGLMIYELRSGWIKGNSTVALRNPLAASVKAAMASVTGVETQTSTTLPEGFSLSQNYPNPFNPTTRISYSLGASANVKITVYNILGQIVATLVDEHQASGTHTVEFSGARLSSGMYFCRMQADTYASTRRMVLMK